MREDILFERGTTLVRRLGLQPGETTRPDLARVDRLQRDHPGTAQSSDGIESGEGRMKETMATAAEAGTLINRLQEGVWELAALVVALRDDPAGDQEQKRQAQQVLVELGLMSETSAGIAPAAGLAELIGSGQRDAYIPFARLSKVGARGDENACFIKKPVSEIA